MIKFLLVVIGYIAAFSIAIVLWNYTWPQFWHVGPDSWRWWLRTLMIGAVITFYISWFRRYQLKQNKQKQRSNDER